MVGVCISKSCGVERTSWHCQALMEPASNVDVMIQIAESFAEDLYHDGDPNAESDQKIQLPRMKRPPCIGSSGAAKRRAMKAEEEAESEAPLGTLSSRRR